MSTDENLKDEVCRFMADVIPFPCIRPRVGMVKEVAALPYDVYNRQEAKEEIRKHPHSFLRIDAAEATLSDSVDPYDDQVYRKARTSLDEAIADGVYTTDPESHYYLYRLCTPDGHCQTGVVGCASIDDYANGVIKKHENTRENKEIDRIRHVETCSAHTGPIFLTFRSDGSIEQIVERVTQADPLYDFVADDGVSHTVWCVENFEDNTELKKALSDIPSLYIADGHHRASSAVKTGMLRREAAGKASQRGNGIAGGARQLASDHFLTVIFPSDQLTIYDYNRVVFGLNGLSSAEFMSRVSDFFSISDSSDQPVKPHKKGTFGMFFEGAWRELTIKESCRSADVVDDLDVSLLQDYLLGPILGIDDPRTDKRIDFVGGVRGLQELERRVAEDMTVAFSLYPTAIEELFAVADLDRLMPPKSTWFEPKPRSGIFIHRI